MNKRVTASEANRHFSQLLKHVEKRGDVTLTSHGRVVARIVPASEEDEAKDKAWKQLLADLRKRPTMNIGRWTRDELYDDD